MDEHDLKKGDLIPDDLPSDPTTSYKNIPNPQDIENSNTKTADILDSPKQECEKTVPDSQLSTSNSLLDYLIFNKIGIGGHGEVWAARQASLNRIVAIKKLRQDVYEKMTKTSKTEVISRVFLQEAITTANLDHPNIVPIYALGYDGNGCPFLTMKLVHGKPWKDIICADKDLNSDDYYSKHIAILIQVAQAVSFAHSKSIIHRDLKPTQVMIGEFGEVIVMDWGISYFYKKDASSGVSEDNQNQNLIKYIVANPAGTPAFMAPEQTENSLSNIGPWTDIFLLGGILYYLLTFTPPYDDSDSQISYGKAKEAKIDSPSARAPFRKIPEELVKITQKAMAYSPNDRFGSAREFIEALQDYISGAGKRRESAAIVESVMQNYSKDDEDYSSFSEKLSMLIRAESLWHQNPNIKPLREMMNVEFTKKALQNNYLVLARLTAEHIEEQKTRHYFLKEIDEKQQQNKRIAKERKLALYFVGILLSLMIAGGIQYSFSQKAARIRAENAHEEALRQKAIAEHEQYLSGIGFANAYEQEGRFDKATSTLMEHIPKIQRNWEWGFILNKLFSYDMLLCKGPIMEELFHADFSPDGSRIVTGQRNGIISLWDSSTGRKLLSKKLPLKGIWTSKFSPDGTKILATSVDGIANILDASTLLPCATLSGMTGAKRPVMRGGGFSPDGKFAVTTGNDRYARVWDIQTGQQVHQILLPQNTYDAAYSPDGSKIAVAQSGNKVTEGIAQVALVNAKTGAIIRDFPDHTKSVYSVRFSPDGKRLLTACLDQKARIFNVDTGKLLVSVENPNIQINCAVFNSDGTIIATAGQDGICRIWDSTTGNLITNILCAPEVIKLAFHPKEKKLLTISYYEIKMWDIDRIVQKASVISKSDVPTTAPLEHIRATSLPYDRKGEWISYDDFWIAGEGRTYFQLKNNYYCVDSYYKLYSPDEKWRIDIDYMKFSAIVYSTITNQPVAKLRDSSTFNACVSHNGKLAATGSMLGELQIWDTATWKEIAKYQTPDKLALWSLQFSPDDSLLAIGWLNGGIMMWDVAHNKISYEIKDAHVKSKPVTYLAFSPNGDKFVSASCDKSAKVWETKRGKLISSLWGHQQGDVLSAVFSPDEARILTVGFDNKMKLWETKTGWEILNVVSIPKDQGLMAASFSKDGKRIFGITKTGNVLELNTLPWADRDYPESDKVPFLQRVELLKRRISINSNTQLKDLEEAFKY